MDGEEALKERINGVERMLLALRGADLEAIRVARLDVQERMSGFPAEYARKGELEQIRETALRLDKTTMPREAYETAHEALEKGIRDCLTKEVFEATVREWTVWRRSVDDTMAQRVGAAGTWKQLAAMIGAATAIISIVVLLANGFLGG
jgi:hypothetical protein